jgi:two-component system OmpR family response regulator
MEAPLAFVIEDDVNLAAAFGAAITRANYSVEVINDGAVARQRLLEDTPKLVVLDLHIPYVSGPQLLKLIHETSRLSQTHVIVATADAASADALRGRSDLVLLKPIGFQQLSELASRLRTFEGHIHRHD